jgi:diguanylate cyclase (GGDEF)-like protein
MIDIANPLPNERKGSVRRHLAGFGAMLALGMLLAAILFNARTAATERRSAETWYVHTLDVLLATEKLKGALHGALRGERGYLLTSDPTFLRPYEKARAETPALINHLRNLTRDNARQHSRVVSLDPLLQSYYGLLEKTIGLEQSGNSGSAIALVRAGAGRSRIEALLGVLEQIDAEERRLLIERREAYGRAARASDRDSLYLSGLALLFLVITAGAAISASRARLRYLDVTDQLNQTATTDELTGLANRRSFMRSLDIELERARRSSSPLTMAIIDIDHFKRVNDTYGHPAGDEVLRSLAATIKGAMRMTDVVGRLGGEEFAILMPDTDVRAAHNVCDRLRVLSAGKAICLGTAGEINVTLSCGIALLEPEERSDHWVSRADSALYEAKASGRNQVKLAA